MAGKIVEFLQYGADARPIQALDASITAPFLPALALAATDSAWLLTPLLSSLVSDSDTPRALEYAGLDYDKIAREVVLGGQAGSSGAGSQSQEEENEEQWDWAEDEESAGLEECDLFLQGNETERVKLALVSLRKHAAKFKWRWIQGDVSELGKLQQQEDNEGSIWSNDACLPELLCLLPVVTSRCPSLLTPEHLIKGLLIARYGCLLLVTTLANNPSLVEQGALFLAQVLKTQAETSDARPNSPLLQDFGPAAATGTAKDSGGLHRQQSGPIPYQAPLPSTEQADAAFLTLIKLCQVAPSLASTCREALVNRVVLVELALHITVELLHDELNFLSRLIFSRESTSQWILSHMGARQKPREVLILPPLSVTRAVCGGLSDSGRPKEKEGSAARVRDALLADARGIWQDVGWGGRLYAHLRLYCVLIRAGDLVPTHEEVDFWLKVLGSNSGFVSVRTLQLGMSFVCLVPGLAGPSTKHLFHSAMGCLLRAATTTSSAACTPPSVELAVWLAVQLLLRRFSDIAVLVREAVGMHVTVQNALMRDVAEAALGAGVISDASLVANAAASLRPCSPIAANKKHPDLGLKCMEQLMHATTFNFARFGVDISKAIMCFLIMAQEPIHPVLPQLLQAFAEVSASVPRTNRGPALPFRMRPFSRDWLVAATAPACLLLSGKSSSATVQSSPALSIKNQAKRLAQRLGIQKISPDQHALKGDSKARGDPMATAALVVYYVLCREQISRNIGVDGGVNAGEVPQGELGDEGSWAELLACLPLGPLYTYMEERWSAYENLLPQWLAVATVVLPERFLVSALLQDPKTNGTPFKPIIEGVPETADLTWVGPVTLLSSRIQLPKSPVGDLLSARPSSVDLASLEMQFESLQEDEENDLKSLESVMVAMKNSLSWPLPALRVLQSMGRVSSRWGGMIPSDSGETHLGLGSKVWEIEAAVVRELVPLLLKPGCQRVLQDSFCSWWRCLPSSATEYLIPLLVNSLSDPGCVSNGTDNHSNRMVGLPSQKNKAPQLITLSSSGLQQEPLGLLACSAQVFRTPLLRIVLDLLVELLTANRRICLATATEVGRDGGIKREEVSAALAAQDSAVCQILLEGCLPVVVLGDDKEPGPLLEARNLICATITTLLHTSPLLLKLLHFQGYNPSLVSMMVEGVPTMVQCLDFVGELIKHPLQQCQVFAVILTTQIACANPLLPQSLSSAQQVVSHVTQVRSKVAGSAEFLQEVLIALAQIAAAFPGLAPQVVFILQSCAQAGGPLARSGPARDPALQGRAVAAFKQLIDLKLLHGRPPPLSPGSISFRDRSINDSL